MHVCWKYLPVVVWLPPCTDFQNWASDGESFERIGHVLLYFGFYSKKPSPTQTLLESDGLIQARKFGDQGLRRQPVRSPFAEAFPILIRKLC